MNWIQDVKAAWAAALGTMGVGIANLKQLLDWVPWDLNTLAVLVGIALSLVTIRVQWLNGSKARMELAELRRRDHERLSEVEKRKAEGQPTRRSDDQPVDKCP